MFYSYTNYFLYIKLFFTKCGPLLTRYTEELASVLWRAQIQPDDSKLNRFSECQNLISQVEEQISVPIFMSSGPDISSSSTNMLLLSLAFTPSLLQHVDCPQLFCSLSEPQMVIYSTVTHEASCTAD